MKKKLNHYWNHRILTRKTKKYREFFVTEVHYENGVPAMYAPNMNILTGWDSLKDLKQTIKYIKNASKHPVLDADNWPNKWKKSKT